MEKRWRLANTEAQSARLDPDFELHIIGSTNLESLPWIYRTLQRSGFTAPLALRLEVPSTGDGKPEPDEWTSQLSQLPNLVRLDINLSGIWYDNGIPVWGYSTAVRWPFLFPALRQLILNVRMFRENGIGCALEDYYASSGTLPDGGSPEKYVLEVMILRTNFPRCPGDDDVERLKTIARKYRRIFCAKRAAIFRWDSETCQHMDVNEWLENGLDDEETLVDD